jgi:hypothetical protein
MEEAEREGAVMGKVYTGVGTAENGVIRLDDPAGLPSGRVSVTVEKERPMRARGSIFDIPPPPEGGRPAKELLRELRELRDEWDEDE